MSKECMVTKISETDYLACNTQSIVIFYFLTRKCSGLGHSFVNYNHCFSLARNKALLVFVGKNRRFGSIHDVSMAKNPLNRFKPKF